MVKDGSLKAQQFSYCLDSQIALPEDELQWCSTTLNEIISRGLRLEASVFDTEGRHAKEVLENCRWNTKPLFDDNNGMSSKAYYPGRFKRDYCHRDDPDAIGFLGSSEMLSVQPKPVKFMRSNSDNAKAVSVCKGTILLSRSGTIGNVTYVSDTLERYLISEHSIRIIADNPGYIYAFLKTKVGKASIMSTIYGAVVDQIEPEHLASIAVPDPPFDIMQRIHNLIIKSYALRDESNALLSEAERILNRTLDLPEFGNISLNYFDKNKDLRNYSVNLSSIAGRFDASYHVPIVDAILRHLNKQDVEITCIGDPRISKIIVLPGRFARVYVEEGQGIPFFGGKHLYELDPSNKKYLSLKHHADRIKDQLTLEENMILITRSGTIGKIAIVPNHWGNWIANEHIIRVVPTSVDLAGYLYVFLATDYGKELITKFTYGSVVDEIDDQHVASIPFPLLKDIDALNEINRLALEANAKRTKAYHAEQEAIRITNDEVIYAT